MTDTKKPAHVETATAPLGRPYAETVSLEVVWAAAYVAEYAAHEDTPLRGELRALAAVNRANMYVRDLLAAHPRGARKTEVDHG